MSGSRKQSLLNLPSVAGLRARFERRASKEPVPLTSLAEETGSAPRTPPQAGRRTSKASPSPSPAPTGLNPTPSDRASLSNRVSLKILEHLRESNQLAVDGLFVRDKSLFNADVMMGVSSAGEREPIVALRELLSSSDKDSAKVLAAHEGLTWGIALKACLKDLETPLATDETRKLLIAAAKQSPLSRRVQLAKQAVESSLDEREHRILSTLCRTLRDCSGDRTKLAYLFSSTVLMSSSSELALDMLQVETLSNIMVTLIDEAYVIFPRPGDPVSPLTAARPMSSPRTSNLSVPQYLPRPVGMSTSSSSVAEAPSRGLSPAVSASFIAPRATSPPAAMNTPPKLAPPTVVTAASPEVAVSPPPEPAPETAANVPNNNAAVSAVASSPPAAVASRRGKVGPKALLIGDFLHLHVDAFMHGLRRDLVTRGVDAIVIDPNCPPDPSLLNYTESLEDAFETCTVMVVFTLTCVSNKPLEALLKRAEDERLAVLACSSSVSSTCGSSLGGWSAEQRVCFAAMEALVWSTALARVPEADRRTEPSVAPGPVRDALLLRMANLAGLASTSLPTTLVAAEEPDTLALAVVADPSGRDEAHALAAELCATGVRTSVANKPSIKALAILLVVTPNVFSHAKTLEQIKYGLSHEIRVLPIFCSPGDVPGFQEGAAKANLQELASVESCARHDLEGICINLGAHRPISAVNRGSNPLEFPYARAARLVHGLIRSGTFDHSPSSNWFSERLSKVSLGAAPGAIVVAPRSWGKTSASCRASALGNYTTAWLCGGRTTICSSGKASTHAPIGALHMFERASPTHSTVDAMIRSVARQLCGCIPGFAQALESSVDIRTAFSKDDPDALFDAMIVQPAQTLQPILGRRAGRVLVILDGIDECSDLVALERVLSKWPVGTKPMNGIWLALVATADTGCHLSSATIKKFEPVEAPKLTPLSFGADGGANNNNNNAASDGVVASPQERTVLALSSLLEELGEETYRKFVEVTFLCPRTSSMFNASRAWAEALGLEYSTYEHLDLLRNHAKWLNWLVCVGSVDEGWRPLQLHVLDTLMGNDAATSASSFVTRRASEASHAALAASLERAFAHRVVDDSPSTPRSSRAGSVGVCSTHQDSYPISTRYTPRDAERRFAASHASYHWSMSANAENAKQWFFNDIERLHAVVCESVAETGGTERAVYDAVASGAELVAELLRLAEAACVRDSHEIASQIMGRVSSKDPLYERARVWIERRRAQDLLPAGVAVPNPHFSGLTKVGGPLRRVVHGTGRVSAMALRGQQCLIAASGERVARLWDFERSRVDDVLNGHGEEIRAVALGDNIAVTASVEKIIIVWKRPARKGSLFGRVKDLTGHTDVIHAVALALGGTRVVSASSDRTARIWDVETGAELHRLSSHTAPVKCVAAEKELVLTGSQDKSIRLWRVADGAPLTLAANAHTRDVSGVALNAEATLAASASWDQTTKLWEISSDLKSLTLLRTFQGHAQRVNAVSFVGATALATASYDETVRLWDVASGECLDRFTGHSGDVWAMSVSGSALATGSLDGTCRSWKCSVEAARASEIGHTDAVKSVQVVKARAITGSADRSAIVWNLETGEVVAVFKEHDEIVTSVALSQDYSVAMVGTEAGSVTCYELDPTATREAKWSKRFEMIEGFEDAVDRIEITLDGSRARLTTAAHEGRKILLDLVGGKLERDRYDAGWSDPTSSVALLVDHPGGAHIEGPNAFASVGFTLDRSDVKLALERDPEALGDPAASPVAYGTIGDTFFVWNWTGVDAG